MPRDLGAEPRAPGEALPVVKTRRSGYLEFAGTLWKTSGNICLMVALRQPISKMSENRIGQTPQGVQSGRHAMILQVDASGKEEEMTSVDTGGDAGSGG